MKEKKETAKTKKPKLQKKTAEAEPLHAKKKHTKEESKKTPPHEKPAKTSTALEKEPLQAEINIGMIGHVDAGKTSLVEALTGQWVDTHSEELKRGISIRIGYADTSFYHCQKCSLNFSIKNECPACGAKGSFLRKVSFVDAPGHETLMTTMLSGAAMMNGAILVVAANEFCPQAQTIEHLNAMKIAGIKNIVVAQNKIDLVDKNRALESYKEIQKFLKENNYEGSPVVPVAAHSKANISALIEAIQQTMPSPVLDPLKPAKMYCGRSFDVNRPGTKPADLKGGVLGGTLLQGTIKKNEIIEIAPGFNGKKIATKVFKINCASGELETAKPGGLIAIETGIDPSLAQNDQLKGQVIGALGSLPEPISTLKLEIEFLKRQAVEAVPEIKTNESIVLTIGTMTVMGTVIEAKPGSITVLLPRPVIAEKGQQVAISKKEKMKWRLIAFGRME
ncbi:MAG: translation initiation factor IF-2 subunit gamma [Candidatus Diapherotrites archaeon]